MRFTTIIAALAGTTGVFSHPDSDDPETPATRDSRDMKRCLEDQGLLQAELPCHQGNVRGDTSRRNIGVFIVRGIPAACCEKFAILWHEKEATGDSKGIQGDFSGGAPGSGECTTATMSNITDEDWADVTGRFVEVLGAKLDEPTPNVAELASRGDKPSKLWPKPLQEDWRCMKEEGTRYPDVKGDWSRKKEGVFTAWGFSSKCCEPFARQWAEAEKAGKTRGIHAEFSNTKGGKEEDCDKVVMSHIKKIHWPYLNRFWADFGVEPHQH